MFLPNYHEKDDFVIVRRHWVIMVFRYLKFAFFLIISILLYIIALKLNNESDSLKMLVQYVMFPIIFLLLNYAFIKLLLYSISYHNKLIIFQGYRIILVEATILKLDYIEIINIDKITKFDTYIDGIIPNLFNFGTLVIEQQRERLRELHFVPNPHRAVVIVSEAKNKLMEQGKSKD